MRDLKSEISNNANLDSINLDKNGLNLNKNSANLNLSNGENLDSENLDKKNTNLNLGKNAPNPDKSLLKFYLFALFATFSTLIFWLVINFKQAPFYMLTLAFLCLAFLAAAAIFILKKLK